MGAARFTPRQLLRDKLAQLNRDIAQLRGQKALIDRQYGKLKAERQECVMLLKQGTAKLQAAFPQRARRGTMRSQRVEA
jgi:hypothetical protein